MTEKQLSNGFDHLRESIDELRMGLCVFMAKWLLAMPVGLPYEDWVFLHRLKGDYE